MFLAGAHSFRQKSRLAISLSWVAGYTNAVVFIACGLVISHVTGTTTMLGKSAAEGAPAGIWLFGAIWLSFFCGAAASAFMTESARRNGLASKYILPLAVEALLLTLVAIGIRRYFPLQSADSPRCFIAGTAAFAMGLQNATITRISGAVIRTTHLTGVTTDLGIEAVQYLFWFRDRLIGRRPGRAARIIRVSRRHPGFLRLLLLGSIFFSFLFGATIGTAVFLRLPTIALAFPVSFLVWMIYVDWRQPIAGVREIDSAGDQELKVQGIGKSILPDELGIWRVVHKRAGKWHRAPDFEQWLQLMPRHWRVVILSLNPLTRFDANALLDLQSAAEKLHQQHRRLVLAGVTSTQYRAIADSGAAALIDPANICPDLEFAIARGIELLREWRSSRQAVKAEMTSAA